MRLFDFLSSTKRPRDGIAVCSPDEVRERILAVNRETAPFQITDGASEGVDLIAEWKIVDAQWYEIFAKAGLKRVFRISLRLDPARQVVRAQDREWQVAW